MKKVSIMYNPYQLITDITVDEKNPKESSILYECACEGSRLQEWVEELPRILQDQYADNEFEITFHGTNLDYEDLTSVFDESVNKGELVVTFNHVPAKETSDKEFLIDEVFEEIQKGPFDELRDKAIISAFKNAKSSDFEVCVVAPMSAGKSTLINALIGKRLMPSKAEACTAIITRIKDNAMENSSFKAQVYDKDNQLAESYEKLTYEVMQRLNGDENVSVIEASGYIPFTHSTDVSLVLIDTPGPTSHIKEHKEVFYEMLEKSAKPLLLFVMDPQYQNEDTFNLLAKIAKNMEVGGKQSKDRFIFVINKLDTLDPYNDIPEEFVDRVHAYVTNAGIKNPNIYPISALPALNIRLLAGGEEVNSSIRNRTEATIRELNEYEAMHYERYASLPTSIKEEINAKLYQAKQNCDGEEYENPDEALIHTGIMSLEAAIRQYVQKYAKTAKIKNIVDTFMSKLDEQREFEGTKQSIIESIKANDEKAKQELELVLKQINTIRERLDNVQNAIDFKNTVNNAVSEVNKNSRIIIEKNKKQYQKLIMDQIGSLNDVELDLEDAKQKVKELSKFASGLENAFIAELNKLIETNLVDTVKTLFDNYKKKLESLIDEHEYVGIRIDPLKIMTGGVALDTQSIIKNLERVKKVEDGTERVKVGSEWVKNTEKKWYKFWTWFQEDGYWREKYEDQTKYKNVNYIKGGELARDYFMPIQRGLDNNSESAYKYVLEQSNRVADYFNAEFSKLDEVLRGKLSELEICATSKEHVEERIKEIERKLRWLEQIKAKVESILEI